MTEHNHELKFASNEDDTEEVADIVVVLILDPDCPRCGEINQGYLRSQS